MEIIAKLTEDNGRVEFRCEKTGLVVRGDYVEWVLVAAAEMLGDMAEKDLASKVDELETLVEFGEAQPVEVDTARWAHKARFEIVPQCSITMNSTEYRWVAPVASDVRDAEFGGHPVKRIHNMALTRNDSFLDNEPGVAPGSGDSH
ncbi:MAG: hypothetical protein AAFR47_08510 [Pseudomonadota bacterium]